jgi:predicted acyl esterase
VRRRDCKMIDDMSVCGPHKQQSQGHASEVGPARAFARTPGQRRNWKTAETWQLSQAITAPALGSCKQLATATATATNRNNEHRAKQRQPGAAAAIKMFAPVGHQSRGVRPASPASKDTACTMYIVMP